MLLARSVELDRELKGAFMRGIVRKTYWAIVDGEPVEDQFVVDVALAAGSSAIRIKMEASSAAPPARTRFEVLARLGARSLMACFPETGRTHQIRAHLAIAGHPIVGDKIYGSQGDEWFLRWIEGGASEASVKELSWPRQCLHARALDLGALPGRQGCVFVAPWPDDLPALPDLAPSVGARMPPPSR